MVSDTNYNYYQSVNTPYISTCNYGFLMRLLLSELKNCVLVNHFISITRESRQLRLEARASNYFRRCGVGSI